MNILNWIEEMVWGVILNWHCFLHSEFGGYVFTEGGLSDVESDLIVIAGADRSSVLEAVNNEGDFSIDYSGEFAVVSIRKEEVVFNKEGRAQLCLFFPDGRVHIQLWSHSVEGIEKLVNRFMRINSIAELPVIEVPRSFND